MTMAIGLILFLVSAFTMRLTMYAHSENKSMIRAHWLAEIGLCLGLLMVMIGYSLQGGC